MTPLDTALQLNSLGMVPVVIPANRKGPTDAAWQDRRYTDDQLRERFRNNENVGLLLGPPSRVIALDCDNEQAEIDLAELFDGDIPPTVNWKSKRGGQWLFQWDERLAGLDTAVTHCGEVEVRLGAGGKGDTIGTSTVKD